MPDETTTPAPAPASSDVTLRWGPEVVEHTGKSLAVAERVAKVFEAPSKQQRADPDAVAALKAMAAATEASAGVRLWTWVSLHNGFAANPAAFERAGALATAALQHAEAMFPELTAAPAPQPGPAPAPGPAPQPSPAPPGGAVVSPDGSKISVWGGALTDRDGHVWTLRASGGSAGAYLDLDGKHSGLFALEATIKDGVVWLRNDGDPWRTVRVVGGAAVATTEAGAPS